MDLQIGLATTADDRAIRGLCRREAMPGNIVVTYEREPDFSLGCRVTGDDFQVLVLETRRTERSRGSLAGPQELSSSTDIQHGWAISGNFASTNDSEAVGWYRADFRS